MKPKILKTEEDYNRALAQVLDFNAPTPGTPEGDAFELLLLLIEDYEAKNVPPIPDPHPIAAIQYYMESRGLTRRDLEKYLGSRARVSEVLNRKRAITMEMIRNELDRVVQIPGVTNVWIQPIKNRIDMRDLHHRSERGVFRRQARAWQSP